MKLHIVVVVFVAAAPAAVVLPCFALFCLVLP
jgi:hypothetical protein